MLESTDETHPAPVANRALTQRRRAGTPCTRSSAYRLQWLDATDAMLAESRVFLFDHGYEAGLNICAYTAALRL